MKTSSILIVDDDSDAVLSLSRALSTHLPASRIHGAGTATAALQLFKDYAPEAVILDLCLDPGEGIQSGMTLLTTMLQQDPTARILVLTGHSDRENGYTCISLGASSFLSKPVDITHIKILLLDAIDQSTLRRELLQRRRADNVQALATLVGSSTAMQSVREQLQFAASTNQPVLILGETGTGKGLCAAVIHRLSNRSTHRLIRYQPNFTAPEMVNSDLFGHQKGAFTGAETARNGLLVEANEGTLFLDEVDELPIETQVSLLGVFQERRFRPLGSNTELVSDFRLITASNKPIKDSLSSGKIRADFYHRIAHIEVTIPPLRERLEDIPELAADCIKRIRDHEQIPVLQVAAAVYPHLQSRTWPGNIREFQATLEHAVYRAHYRGSTVIDLCDIPSLQQAHTAPVDGSISELVKHFKAKLVNDALLQTGGNQVKAASRLGINRSTLRRILDEVEGKVEIR